MKKIVYAIILISNFIVFSQLTLAEVSTEEAERLQSDLMPLGGEKAGNADGTIPPWDGGYTTIPAGYKSGEPRLDPFADEKPLFTITVANMDKYADKLDEGQHYLLRKYPDYKLNVYPTHRTAAAPEWVYEETFKNATRAKLNGYQVEDAYGGIPFPIPKSGIEVLWNHSLRVRPPAYLWPFHGYTIDKTGTVTLVSGGTNEFNVPYYDKDKSYEALEGTYVRNFITLWAPAYRAGELVMLHDKLNNSRLAWQYLVGQRRVRRAPTMCCDTPNFFSSGVDFFDQIFIMFGPFDNYKWKIIGKKEMYIPYNMNGFFLGTDKDLLGKYFPNTDLMRWELHRVWELEGTLREGRRDVRPRRKIYVDEDSWIAMIGNTWDAQGTLWHTTIGFPRNMFELPSLAMEDFATLDFIKGTYVVSLTTTDVDVQLENVVPFPDTYYTPQGMAIRGIR